MTTPGDMTYIVLALMDTRDKTEEWTEFHVEHVEDMVRNVPGFLASRVYRVRPDFTAAHPETLPTRPPYDLVTYYELDQRGVDFVTTRRPAPEEGPAGGSRPFPGPLGPHMGDSYLLEAVSQLFVAPASDAPPPPSARGTESAGA